MLEEEEAEDAVEDGKGIQLWTKGENADGDADLGPFDDDATRSFYCDVPDLLTTKPPALLGIGEKELEEMKERNLQKYGGDGEDEEDDEGEGELATVDETGEEGSQKEDAEMEEAEDKDEGEKDAEMQENETGEKDDAEMKDTPHYRLMVLLEEELPEASRRDTIDDLADRFCVNHGSNRKSRKRLYETLFLVPRSRLDLLPYYARFACTVDKVYPDSTLVQELEQQFHGQARFKKNQNLEARMRTARYLGELTKFRVAPPMVVLRGIRRCLEGLLRVQHRCRLLPPRIVWTIPVSAEAHPPEAERLDGHHDADQESEGEPFRGVLVLCLGLLVSFSAFGFLRRISRSDTLQ